MDVDNTFEPKEAFRLIITTTSKDVVEKLKEKVALFKVECPDAKDDERT